MQWRGFATETEIETFAGQFGFGQLNRDDILACALVFDGLDSVSSESYPNNHKISYKIRLVDTFYNTDELMPSISFGGPGMLFDFENSKRLSYFYLSCCFNN